MICGTELKLWKFWPSHGIGSNGLRSNRLMGRKAISWDGIIHGRLIMFGWLLCHVWTKLYDSAHSEQIIIFQWYRDCSVQPLVTSARAPAPEWRKTSPEEVRNQDLASKARSDWRNNSRYTVFLASFSIIISIMTLPSSTISDPDLSTAQLCDDLASAIGWLVRYKRLNFHHPETLWWVGL